MKQEDKQLLIKDLCARLPYGVKVRIYNDSWEGCKKGEFDNTMGFHHVEAFKCDRIEIEPYLRPMSSMFKDEKEELVDFGLAYWDDGKHTDENGNTIIYGGKEIQLIPDIETYDWLNERHFDYRGLIEKGLALEAHEGMYGKKE